jgi:hemerythrin-like domain-containing protein
MARWLLFSASDHLAAIFFGLEFAMSTLSKSAVVQAFLVDHRKFMKLLRDVGQALRDKDVEKAKTLGRELNRVAGPHIAFEEQVLYPTVEERTHDRVFVAKLYDEHQSIVRALARLLDASRLEAQDIVDLQNAFAQGVDHAEHCGTLISSLSAMDEVDQQEALDELKQLRATGMTWMQLRKDT